MFVSPVMPVRNNNVYSTKSNRVKNNPEVNKPDSVSFKSYNDAHIQKYLKTYISSYDTFFPSLGATRAKFQILRDAADKFPVSDRGAFYKVLHLFDSIDYIIDSVRTGATSFASRVADVARQDFAIPLLEHDGEVIVSMHNNGTYGSDNGGNWLSVFNFGKEDFQIMFHRAKSPDVSDDFAKSSYMGFSLDVDGDLVYTKSPVCEYTFYTDKSSCGGLKKEVETDLSTGRIKSVAEYEKNGRPKEDSLGRDIKKWFGF